MLCRRRSSERGVNGFEAKSTGQGTARAVEAYRGGAGPANRQAATGNWRLVKKGIRTQLEGNNNKKNSPGPGAAASFVRSTER